MATRRTQPANTSVARKPEPLSPSELAFVQALARVFVERQSASHSTPGGEACAP